MTFGERLKRLRSANGITQKQLAQSIGASERGIQQYELGERNPNYSALLQLSAYFNVTSDYLLGRGAFENWEIVMEQKEVVFEWVKATLPMFASVPFESLREIELMPVFYAIFSKIEIREGQMLLYMAPVFEKLKAPLK